MGRTRRMAVLLLAMVLATPTTLCAADLIDAVPGDALGFVAVNRLADVDAKVSTFAEKTGLPVNPPMAWLEQSVGFGPGVDMARASGMVFVAGEDDIPVPLWYVPVSDFDAFTESLGGTPSGDRVEVQFMGQTFLAGQTADYAVIVETAQGDLMEQALASETTLAESAADARDWIADKDAVLLITGTAIQLGVRSFVDARAAHPPLLGHAFKKTAHGSFPVKPCVTGPPILTHRKMILQVR